MLKFSVIHQTQIWTVFLCSRFSLSAFEEQKMQLKNIQCKLSNTSTTIISSFCFYFSFFELRKEQSPNNLHCRPPSQKSRQKGMSLIGKEPLSISKNRSKFGRIRELIVTLKAISFHEGYAAYKKPYLFF